MEPIGGTKLALVSLALAALERAVGDGCVPGELVIDYLGVARGSAGP